jgi:hypothetical protein
MYVILEATEVNALEAAVRDHQKGGWRVAGGPFTYTYAPGHGPVAATPAQHPGCDGWLFFTFCQAMERED